MNGLILQAPFEDMPQFTLLLVAAAAIWLLVKGADLFIQGAASLAHQMGIPKIIVGATIVSLGTTCPEAAISVMAAWEGKPHLALGNAVGSIITDTGLIFGLGCVLTVLPANRFFLRRHGWTKACTDLLLVTLCYGAWAVHGDNATLGLSVGLLLLGLLVTYLFVSVRWSRQHSYGEPRVTAVNDQVATEDLSPAAASAEKGKNQSSTGPVIMLVIGLVLVIFASHFVISSVTVLATYWHIPQDVIAATLVAFGTSLPELTVGMTSLYRGHKELLVGNVIGADILNVLFVIGASATARPLAILPNFLYLHLPMLTIMMLLFLTCILIAARSGHFKRWFGVPLLALYVAYVALLLLRGEM